MGCLLVVLILFVLNKNWVLRSSAMTSTEEVYVDACGLDLSAPTGLDQFVDVPFIKKVFRHFVPSFRPNVSMNFYLYTPKSPFCGQEIRLDDDSLERSLFNATAQTRILIHGWMSQSKGQFGRSLKNAYLSVGDFNVVVVDWSVHSANLNYYSVVKCVEDFGVLLANFTQLLVEQAGADYNDIYLVGHSLGAQIAGSAGKHIAPFQYNTIFALDPASPAFKGNALDFRIDSTDARYVESIQTSAATLGLSQPVGNASFYPNFGNYQKCFFYGCSHIRSYQFFAESITSGPDDAFWGTRCSREQIMHKNCPKGGTQEWFRMGGEPSSPKQGVFYVKTNVFSPYARGRGSIKR